MGYGTGAIMAVPGHDERDFEFAKTFDLPILRCRRPDLRAGRRAARRGRPEVHGRYGVAVNSANERISLDGLPTAEAKSKMIAWLEAEGRWAGRR